MFIQQIKSSLLLTGNRTGSALLLALCFLAPTSIAAPPCGEWDMTSTPNRGDKTNWLSSVSARSAADAWSVGIWRNAAGGQGPLAIQWDGETWSEVELPDTSGLGTSPVTTGVEFAGSDLWIVGYLSTPYPTNNLPLVMRQRDGDWDYVETVALRKQTEYPYSDRGGFLAEAAALSADDIWAVGLAAGFGDARATSVPLAVHWDGDDWTDVDVPLISNRHHELNDVVAIASDDVWAVGDYRFIAGTFRGVTYHWDGEAWSHIPSPIEDLSQSGLNDVAASGPDNVWALGGAPDTGVVLMRWDGDEWSLMEPPPNSGGSLAVLGPQDVWVSGWYGFWHWDGSAWTEVPATIDGATYVIRGGGMELVGDCDIWNVGFWTLEDGITGYTLAERLSANSPPVARGDLNCDGATDFNDIDPFVVAVISRDDYESQYPACNWFNGDINADGAVTFDDIDGFVECLINGRCN